MPVYKACVGQPGAALQLSIEDYVQRYGKNSGKHPFCPVCDIQLSTHAVSSPNMLASFHHPTGNPNNCVLVKQQAGRFPALEACYFNEEYANANRATFHQNDNIKAAYVLMWSLCGKGNFSATQFSECVKIADATNIWAYRNLKQWQIPFILLTLRDFEFKESGHGFRFTLKKNHGCSKAYWQTPEKCELLKVFSDSGNPVKSLNNPALLSEEFFKNISARTDWLQPGFIDLLKSTA